jgi:hypothetical protein
MNNSQQLALSVLDGPLKGKVFSLRKNLTLKGPQFSDEEMGDSHAEVFLDHNMSWNIKSLNSNKIRMGSGESDRISLILGLIFHLGQTGFKVVEKPKLNLEGWEEALTAWFEEQDWQPKQTDFFFFLYPVRMTFLSGPQSDEFFTISYGPREMGFNHFDLNIKDPTQPKKIVRFYQIGESAYVENMAGGLGSDKVLVNKNRFDHHAIADGDRLQFGAHLIEFTILR